MIISLDEARKILGEDGNDLSDEQLEQMVDTLDGIARETIRAIMRGEFLIPDDGVSNLK